MVTAAVFFSRFAFRGLNKPFCRMLEFLKQPVVVTAEINVNLVALTVMGLVNRLWALSYPRAVV